MGIIYSILYALALFIYLPVFIFITKKKGYSPELKDRFVLYQGDYKNCIWLHCASIGELNVARPIIEYFKKEREILITVSSPRGKKYAKKVYPFATVRTVPFDLPFLVNRFIKMHKPSVLIVVEGELWFNLITVTSRFIPVISVNTRISPSSYRVYRKLKPFYKKILNSFSLLIVRTETDRNYLQEFVKQKEKIVMCGDLKFVSSKGAKTVNINKEGRVVVAGSTHFPEEKIIIKAFQNLKKEFPDLKLVIAPRHLERVSEVEKIVQENNLSCSLRTETDQIKTDVYILDTVGELSGFYKHADAVFVGGTFAPVGGHNILEAVLQNRPVVIGPNYYKIKDTVEEIKKTGFLKIASDEKDLERRIKEFLTEKLPEIDFSQISENIYQCYISNIKGAVNGHNR
ncbi:glycosyltransferase [Persephonella atlantica]|uniref:3-deoxy-D-manno-octulosonic acid transferase n=1 Tax=Persephonella atlantica TaxID=2699429 RepID=A0ABS1GHC7_9AQUI|nr:glycosyltransferase N-terminal domain-containing protein [Persephonella atlantica]MBK3332226.1 glycosyltransferase [Persephonella atlantica]